MQTGNGPAAVTPPAAHRAPPEPADHRAPLAVAGKVVGREGESEDLPENGKTFAAEGLFRYSVEKARAIPGSMVYRSGDFFFDQGPAPDVWPIDEQNGEEEMKLDERMQARMVVFGVNDWDGFQALLRALLPGDLRGRDNRGLLEGDQSRDRMSMSGR